MGGAVAATSSVFQLLLLLLLSLDTVPEPEEAGILAVFAALSGLLCAFLLLLPASDSFGCTVSVHAGTAGLVTVTVTVTVYLF
jgi:hypothetical protein